MFNKFFIIISTSKLLPGNNEFRKLLSFITIVALLLRVGVMIGNNPLTLKYDEVDYYMLGKNLYEGKGFVAHEKTQVQFQGGNPGEPTAYRTIILPAFLALHFFIFGDHIIFPKISLIILSALCCIYIGLLGRKAFNAKVGLISALVWAFYPTALLSWYSADKVFTEGLGIFFLIASFYYLLFAFRNYSFKNIFASAVLFGLAILTRGYLALALPLVVAYLFFFATEKKFKTAFLFGLFASIIIGSWMTRNYFVMGKPVLSTQTDSFYWGNNDWTKGSVNKEVFTMSPWTAPQVQNLVIKYPGIQNYSEIQLSEVWSKEAFEYMKLHPSRTLSLGVKKTAAYILPLQVWSAGFYKIHYVYLFLLIGTIAAFYIIKNRKEYFLLLLPFAGGWIATLLTISMDRYRYTVEPFFIVIGVFGLLEIWSNYKNRHKYRQADKLIKAQ